MAKRGSYFPIRIDVPSLSGGVGRASPAKRIPTESENIDNMICSLEHSAEKRQGVELISWSNDDDYDNFIDGRLEGVSDAIDDIDAPDKDLWFHWFLVSNEKKYLIVVDYKATTTERQLLWVYSLDSNDNLNEETVRWPTQTEEDTANANEAQANVGWLDYANGRKYLTHGSSTFTAKEALRAVAVGSSILILNTKVKAGFTSSTDTDPNGNDLGTTGILRNMDGTVTNPNITDYLGQEIKYATSITVDTKSEAEYWTEYSQYIAGDKAIDTTARLSGDSNDIDNSDPFGDNDNDYRYLQYKIFQVKDAASTVVGPDGTGNPVRRPNRGISSENLNLQSVTTGVPPKYFKRSYFSGGTESTRSVETWTFQNNHEYIAGTATVPTAILDSADADTFNGQKIGFPHWLENVTYESTTSPQIPRMQFDTTLSYTGTSSYSFFSDTGLTSTWEEGDPVNSNCRMKVGIKNVNSVSVLMNHIANAINAAADKGFFHVRAIVNSSGNGLEVTTHFYVSQWEDTGEVTDYMEPDNYFYPDQNKRYLGQAVAALNDLKFPPTESDFTAFNGGNVVEGVFKELYPDIGNMIGADPQPTGLGKIYYLSQQYLGLSEGYYRVRSIETQPYLHKVRTPDEMSVIDGRRMPRQLVFDDSYSTPSWDLRQVDWDPRDSGDNKSNPGPSIFHDGNENALQREISAMSFYRGRLFLASEDVLVSSRINDFDNLYISSPDNLSVSDPIDLRVSSNAYTPITYLQPYRNFLFLATNGDTQYELLGSENQISPLTAEIAPTSFYNMTLDVEPVLLNNSLFFLSENKLYIYFGEQTDSNQNAVEISVNCPDYLPTNYNEITTSPVLNSLFILDGDATNTVYCYTNRISGTEIAQNSFFRFIFPTGWTIKSMKAIGEYLYLVWQEEMPDAPGSSNTWTTVNCGKIHLKNEDLDKPRMDSLNLITQDDIVAGPTVTGTGDDQKTTVWIKSPTIDINTIVLWYNGEGIISNGTRGDILTPTVDVDETYESQGAVSLTVSGDQSGSTKLGATEGFYVGKTFTSTVELSPLFYRDQNMAAQNGSLNLRLGMVRFRNSGDFKVSVQRKERDADIFPFTIDVAGKRSQNLTYTPYSEFGVLKLPVLSFTQDATIKIISDSVHPLSISDIEFTAKFKYKTTDLGTL